MIINILLFLGIIMIINGVFSYKQMKVTSDICIELRKKGDLVIGQKRFLLLFVSNIVIFAIDETHVIKDAVRIAGMLPFQHVKKIALPYYINKKFVGSMNPKHADADRITTDIVSRMISKNT